MSAGVGSAKPPKVMLTASEMVSVISLDPSHNLETRGEGFPHNSPLLHLQINNSCSTSSVVDFSTFLFTCLSTVPLASRSAERVEASGWGREQ